MRLFSVSGASRPGAGYTGRTGARHLAGDNATKRSREKKILSGASLEQLWKVLSFINPTKKLASKSISKFTKLKDRAELEKAYSTYASKFMQRILYARNQRRGNHFTGPGKTNPKATGADRRRSVKPRFLKELEDQGVIAQLYRQ